MKESSKNTIKLGLMMLALFLGAGNMIFPPKLGYLAGDNLWPAIIGFLITGVGLPLLGVTAVAVSGSSLRDIAGRAHPLFGLIFTLTVYLAIGPLFGIPRTSTVAYEIGAAPFIPNPGSDTLVIYTIFFFSISLWLSLKPGKIVDRFGKYLTPILVVVIAAIVITGLFNPFGHPGPAMSPYESKAILSGFIKGYLTMDAIAALVFGIVIVNTIKSKGYKNNKTIAKMTLRSGVIAVTGLGLIYLSLAYLGAMTRGEVPESANGGDILTFIANTVLGTSGQLLLGIAITFACLTTSVGLITACSSFISGIMPRVSYKTTACLLALFSLLVANLGLSQLILFMTPILVAIYPLAIILMILSFLHKSIAESRYVYIASLTGTGVISVLDAIKAYGFEIGIAQNILELLPLYNQMLGWLIPAVVLGAIGYIVDQMTSKKIPPENQHS